MAFDSAMVAWPVDHYRRRCTHSAPARSNRVTAPLLERIDEQQQKTESDIQGVGKGHHKMIANCVRSKPMISRSKTSVRSTQSSCRGKETSFIETGKPDHGCKNSVEKSFSGYKHSSLRASQTRPHTVASESVDRTQQMTKGTLRRTLSNPKWNNSLMRSENGDVQYYRPMSLSARRRRTKSVQSEKPRQPETDPTKPQPIKHAWDSFRGHIAMLTGGDGLCNGHRQPASLQASEIHNQVISDLKAKSLRRKTKTMIMSAKLMKAKEYLVNAEEEDILETDSEEEEEREIQRKKKQTAQRHWGTIRRDVNDKIRVRKGNNVAGMSWNILRHQVRAQTQAEAVRLELYVKYGVVKPSANVQPIDKPTLSETAQQLIAVFENLEVKNIDDNVFSAAKISKFTEEKTQS